MRPRTDVKREDEYSRATGPVQGMLALPSPPNGTQQWSFPDQDMSSMRGWDQTPTHDARNNLYATQQIPWLPNQLQTQQPGQETLQPYLYWNTPQQ